MIGIHTHTPCCAYDFCVHLPQSGSCLFCTGMCSAAILEGSTAPLGASLPHSPSPPVLWHMCISQQGIIYLVLLLSCPSATSGQGLSTVTVVLCCLSGLSAQYLYSLRPASTLSLTSKHRSPPSTDPDSLSLLPCPLPGTIFPQRLGPLQKEAAVACTQVYTHTYPSCLSAISQQLFLHLSVTLCIPFTSFFFLSPVPRSLFP